MYINDLTICNNILIYADDTTLYANFEDFSHASPQLEIYIYNINLEKTNNWFPLVKFKENEIYHFPQEKTHSNGIVYTITICI